MPELMCGFEMGEGNTTFLTSEGWVFFFADLSSTAGYQHRSATGFGGSWAARLTTANATLTTPAFGVTTTNRWISFAALFPNSTTFGLAWTMQIKSGASVQATIRATNGGFISVYRGDSATLLATSTLQYPVTGVYVEVNAFIDNAGQIQVFLNRSATAFVDTGAGIDTQALGAAGFDTLTWIQHAAAFSIDDVMINTAAEGRGTAEWFCPSIRPNADVVGSTLTAVGAASHYLCVNEVGNPTTGTYDEATAALQTGFYEDSNLAWSPPNVAAIKVYSYVSRDGTITRFQNRIISGGVGGDAAYYTIPGAVNVWKAKGDIFPTDPNGGGAWTAAAVNAVQTGTRFDV